MEEAMRQRLDLGLGVVLVVDIFRPIKRDAVYVNVLRYHTEDYKDGISQALLLPNGSWHMYSAFDVLPVPTLTIPGNQLL